MPRNKTPGRVIGADKPMPLRTPRKATVRETVVKAGQPTKRTPERRLAILQSLEAAPISLAKAAAAAGIHRDTLHEWLKDDPTFSDDIHEAKGKFVLRNAANIARLSQRDLRGALASAKATDPEFWEEHIVIDVRSVAAQVAAAMGLGDDPAAVEQLMVEARKMTGPKVEASDDA
jgi:hypothetical protein